MSHLILYFYQFDFTNILQQKRNRKTLHFWLKVVKYHFLLVKSACFLGQKTSQSASFLPKIVIFVG